MDEVIKEIVKLSRERDALEREEYNWGGWDINRDKHIRTMKADEELFRACRRLADLADAK